MANNLDWKLRVDGANLDGMVVGVGDEYNHMVPPQIYTGVARNNATLGIRAPNTLYYPKFRLRRTETDEKEFIENIVTLFDLLSDKGTKFPVILREDTTDYITWSNCVFVSGEFSTQPGYTWFSNNIELTFVSASTQTNNN